MDVNGNNGLDEVKEHRDEVTLGDGKKWCSDNMRPRLLWGVVDGISVLGNDIILERGKAKLAAFFFFFFPFFFFFS